MTEETALPTNLSAAPAFSDELVAGYRERVRALVSPARFEHILRVTETARGIAEANRLSGQELAQVTVAALLHDAARDLPNDELMRLAPPANELEARHPLTLHGRAGRRLAEGWGVADEAVLEAIEGHVFGVPAGHNVGMCVYVADVCEPGRGVNDDLRALAMSDLGAAYRAAVESKVTYLQHAGKPVHPDTLATYRQLRGGEA